MSKKDKRRQRHKRRVAARLQATQTPSEVWLSAGGAGGVTLEAAEGDGDGKLRKFKGTAYTGGAMRPPGFYRDIVVDFAGLNVPRQKQPILLQHDPVQIVGHSEEVTVDGKVAVAGVVSGVGNAAAEVVGSSTNGFPWQMSIGASLEKVIAVDEGETVEVNGRKFTGPILVARKATLKEISFVANGADSKTSAKVAASATNPHIEEIPMKFEQWLEALGFQVADLTEDQTTKLRAKYDAEQKPPEKKDPEPSKDVKASGDKPPDGTTDDDSSDKLAAKALDEFQAKLDAKLAAADQEAARKTEIRLICSGGRPEIGTKEHPDIEAKAVEEKWTAAQTEVAVLKAERPKAPAAHTPDGTDRNAKAIEAALCMSAGLKADDIAKDYGEKAMDVAMSRDLRGAGIHTLVHECAQAVGVRVRPGQVTDSTYAEVMRAENRMQLQAAGWSTISLSGILGNVAEKSMLASFASQETIASQFCGTNDHSDFKTHTRYRMTAAGIFVEVGAGGELESAELTEESFPNQVKTYGRMFALTRTMLINDDLGAFLQIPRAIGRMSALAVEERVFTVLLSNPSSFFGAGNSNQITAVLAIAGLTEAEQVFLDLTDSDGNPILINPRLLLVPTDLKVTGEKLFVPNLVNETTTADTPSPNINPHQGKFKVLCSPYLSMSSIPGYSTTAWYLLAAPSDGIAVAEIAYLRGQRTPTIESADTSFNTLGTQWRGYFDFGVAMQETRAGVKSTGAG
jgi:hypothetical protein